MKWRRQRYRRHRKNNVTIPDIKWIFSHSGGVTPFLVSRFEREARALKDLKTKLPNGFKHELAKFYYDMAQGNHPGALKKHRDDGQIVEITALVSFFGFFNRWNDSLATPLVEEPIAVAEKHLARPGWTLGKHRLAE